MLERSTVKVLEIEPSINYRKYKESAEMSGSSSSQPMQLGYLSHTDSNH
jgi:hypothetical protein